MGDLYHEDVLAGCISDWVEVEQGEEKNLMQLIIKLACQMFLKVKGGRSSERETKKVEQYRFSFRFLLFIE